MTIQIAAVSLMVWARITFGRRSFHAAANPTEGGLVTGGPYAFVRHPIYAAVMFFAWPGALTHVSAIPVGLAVIATSGLFVRVIAEERLVAVRYPEYAEYAKRTRRLIPYVF